MKTKEIVRATISGTIICLVVIILAYGIVKSSRKEAASPYTTTITVTSEREFAVWNKDFKTMANIEIDNEYSFTDYRIDYDNNRIIINLKKRTQAQQGQKVRDKDVCTD